MAQSVNGVTCRSQEPEEQNRDIGASGYRAIGRPIQQVTIRPNGVEKSKPLVSRLVEARTDKKLETAQMRVERARRLVFAITLTIRKSKALIEQSRQLINAARQSKTPPQVTFGGGLLKKSGNSGYCPRRLYLRRWR